VNKVKQIVKQNRFSSGEPHRNRTCNLLIKSLCATVLISHFRYKLELLCQTLKTCFERRIPVSYIAFYSVY